MTSADNHERTEMLNGTTVYIVGRHFEITSRSGLVINGLCDADTTCAEVYALYGCAHRTHAKTKTLTSASEAWRVAQRDKKRRRATARLSDHTPSDLFDYSDTCLRGVQPQ